MSKYQEYLTSFEQSGFSQKDYTQRIGKSASSVSRVLKPSRSQQMSVQGFQTIEISESSSTNLIISLPNDTGIDIPI